MIIMTRQHTVLLLPENANESQSSAILHQKTQSILFYCKTHHFPKSRIRYIPMRIWGGRDQTCITSRITCLHQSNRISTQINFENILIENIRKKTTLIAEGQQISFKRMTLHAKLIFLFYCIGSILPMPYAYNCMHFACFSFCLYAEKISNVIGLNRLK